MRLASPLMISCAGRRHCSKPGYGPRPSAISKIAPLRAILQWGVDNRKLAANPASRIVVDVRAKIGERIRGFTDEERLESFGRLRTSKTWSSDGCHCSVPIPAPVCQRSASFVQRILLNKVKSGA